MWVKDVENAVLETEEVHIWQANLGLHKSSLTSFLKLLSLDEKNRANKFKFKKDYLRFVIGRGILRKLLGKYVGINPTEISFQYGEYGKPSLPKQNLLQFNISHSKDLILLAFSRNVSLGVDLEYLNSHIEIKEIATRFFTKNEVKSLLALPEKQQIVGFFNCWTRKEAFIKAVGEGLSFPLDSFEVSLHPDKPAKLLATHWQSDDASKWSIHSIPLKQNFIGSLAVESTIKNIRYLKWKKTKDLDINL